MRDSDIRSELKNSFLKKYYIDSNSKVVNELTVGYGDAIIDIAVINGALHGFEIKSEYDTLNRLPGQLSAYSKTFDYLTIITAKKHLNHLLAIVPEWCGIIIVDSTKGNQKLSHFRKGKRNILVDNYSIAQLLWKDEVLDVLNDLGIHKGIKNKPKPILWAMLANSASSKNLSNIVREKLKIRANWKSEQIPSENGGYFPLTVGG